MIHADISDDVDRVKTACGQIDEPMAVYFRIRAAARLQMKPLDTEVVFGLSGDELAWVMKNVTCEECRRIIAEHPELIR